MTYALIPWGSGGTALEVKLDRAWLDDPARVYPVTMDPEIVHNATDGDTYVMSNFFRDNSTDPEVKVGTYDGAGTNGHVCRTFLPFFTGPINGATVQQATLEATERHSWDCNYWPEPVWRITGPWDGHNMPDWSNQPPTEAGPLSGGTWVRGTCPNRTASWNVTAAAQYWAAHPGESWGLSLRATDEGNNSMYKRYASTEGGNAAVLHVWYTTAPPPPPANRPPAIPTNVRPGYLERQWTSMPTASAFYSDPDGNAGAVAFWLYKHPGTSTADVVWGGWSPVVPNNSWVTVPLPSQPDYRYYLRAIATDGQLNSVDWSPASQWFLVDTLKPNSPTSLTPANGSSGAAPTKATAVYTEPYGMAGSVYFWLTNNPAVGSPLQIIKEGWDDKTLTGVATPNGGTATFTLPTLSAGTYRVYAMAYDGLYSAQVGPNVFTVGSPPPPSSSTQHRARRRRQAPRHQRARRPRQAPRARRSLLPQLPILRLTFGCRQATVKRRSPGPRQLAMLCTAPLSPDLGYQCFRHALATG